MRRVSADERLQTIALLLVPATVGHFIQLAGEDAPWAAWAWPRYYTTPGWHLYLPWPLVGAIAIALVIAAVGLGVRRTRPWLFAFIAIYVAHYLTYPYRIRNHMTTMLSELVVLGGVWLVAMASGATDVHGRGPRARFVDRHALAGVAAVLSLIYASAALHKCNENFLALDERSDAVRGLLAFWIYGDIGSEVAPWEAIVATWGTVIIEALAPVLAWRFRPLRVPFVLALFGFHVPHVAVMNVADYPMIASAFYPALFSRAHYRIFLRHARANGWTLGGAAAGIAIQLWFMPWWGALTAFGIFVLGLWGWASGAMLRMTFKRTSA